MNLIEGIAGFNIYLYFLYLIAVISGAALNYVIHLNVTWKKLGFNIYPPRIRK
jgi:hypothetical protein